MIIGKSKDPVNFKKIPLRIWSLKNEIAATLTYYKANLPDEYEAVKEFYESKPVVGKDEDVIEGVEIDESETPEAETATEATEEGAEVVDIKTGEKTEGMNAEKLVEIRTKVKRVVPDKEHLSHGHLFLFDIDMDQILFFGDKHFKPGQTVVIEFDIDHGFTLKAEVDYVKHIGIKSRIITEYPPHYRLRCYWQLEKPGDRTLLRRFLSSLGQNAVSSIKGDTVEQVIDEGDDEVVIDEGDDFDLGDLGGL